MRSGVGLILSCVTGLITGYTTAGDGLVGLFQLVKVLQSEIWFHQLDLVASLSWGL
jgi:hypothetical protein